eukprot:1156977-Pelagomonas_calceolata.AAC.4
MRLQSVPNNFAASLRLAAHDSDDWLRDKAHEIDARLRGFSSFAALQAGETPSNQHQTLVHGDFKVCMCTMPCFAGRPFRWLGLNTGPWWFHDVHERPQLACFSPRRSVRLGMLLSLIQSNGLGHPFSTFDSRK